MEVGFHFIFELVKIAVLAIIYSTILLITFSILAKTRPGSWFDRATEFKKDSWFAMGFLISISLFIYMFTYWGNHGLGDSPRIPIGKWLVVDNANWNDYGYINDMTTNNGNEVVMTEFLVKKGYLLGKLGSSFHRYNNEYFIYDMTEKTMVEFENQKDFDEYVIELKTSYSSDSPKLD